jgi:hypothetical protein
MEEVMMVNIEGITEGEGEEEDEDDSSPMAWLPQDCGATPDLARAYRLRHPRHNSPVRRTPPWQPMASRLRVASTEAPSPSHRMLRLSTLVIPPMGARRDVDGRMKMLL